MSYQLLWKGFILGLSIAAPVGPIGLLCIRRTLAGGRWAGFVSGLGAATADGIYGCIAGFGLTFLAERLIGQRVWLGLAGGLFLLALGWRTFQSRPALEAAAPKLGGAYLSTFGLTLTNPMTILSFTAMFAGMQSPAGSAAAWPGLLVLGVFLGSACWWLMLSGLVGTFRRQLNFTALKWVNRVSGTVIAGFGAAALGAGITGLL
jgi:threonine/homoserine/homoserine lactone efflux protein